MVAPAMNTAAVAKLGADLGMMGAAGFVAVKTVVSAAAKQTKSLWFENAQASSGSHGRFYPYSITYETKSSLMGSTASIGPDSSKPQGGMGNGFEYGSINQPPHLDGNRAADVVEPLFVRGILAAVAKASSL